MIDVLIVGGIFREVLDGDTEPRRRYGGSGLTASIAAARSGVRVALASYVGDEDDVAVRVELRVAGVDDRCVVTVPGASGTFVFPANEDSDRPWPMYRPAEAVPHAPPPPLPEARVVVAFGIPDFDPVGSGWLTQLGAGAVLVRDRQGWLSRARNAQDVLALAPSWKLYLANEREAMDDAGASTGEEALATQPPPGFTTAVIKRGLRGVVVIEGPKPNTCRKLIDAFPVQAKSTIGSGDVFAGAFAARVSKRDSLCKAARWGCAAAAVALKAGTNLLGDDALPKIEQLLGAAGSRAHPEEP